MHSLVGESRERACERKKADAKTHEEQLEQETKEVALLSRARALMCLSWNLGCTAVCGLG